MIPIPAWVTTKVLLVVGVAVAIGGAYFYGRHAEHKQMALEYDAARAKMVEQHLEEMMNEIERGEKAAKAYDAKVAALKAKYRGYRAATDSLRGCGNPPDYFVRLHDSAVEGRPAEGLSEHTSQLACTPGTARYDQVAGVIAGNAEKCNACITQLNALIDRLEGH